MSEGEQKGLLDISVPLRTEKKITFSQRIISGFHKVAKAINKIRLPLLILGTLFSITIVVYRHSWFDWIIFSIYLILWIYELYVLTYKAKTAGIVLDSQTEKPLDLVLVRLINAKTGKIVSTFVTSLDGQFTFSVPSGMYTISAVRKGFEPLFTRGFHVRSLTRFGKIKVEMKKWEKRSQ